MFSVVFWSTTVLPTWMDAASSQHAVARLRQATTKTTISKAAATAAAAAASSRNHPWTIDATTTTNSSSILIIRRRRLQVSRSSDSASAADAAAASSTAVESGIAFGANSFYGSTATTGKSTTQSNNATNDNFTINNANGQFNPIVFWGVNAFLFVLLLTACFWCWWCGGWKWSAASSSSSSDVEYRRRLAEQQPQQPLQDTAALDDDPETRQRKIMASFDRCHVKQVVTSQDFVEPADESLSFADAANSNKNNERDEGNRLERPVLVETNHDGNQDTSVMGALNKILWNGNFGTSFSDLKEEEVDDHDDDTDADADADDSSKVQDDCTLEETDLEAAVTSATTTSSESQIEDNVTAAPLLPSSSTAIDSKQELSDNESGERGKEEEDNDDEYDAAGHIRIQGGQRLVPNCCAICLSQYEVGETIVWSSNTDCRHAFHEECITDWLVKLHVQPTSPPLISSGTTTTPVVVVATTPCPCCRQEFTVLEEDKEDRRVEQKVPWSSGRLFHPRSSSSP